MIKHRLAFAAALLAGGKSSRMGADKALLDWNGVPLWRAQLGKLIELNPDRLLLSCRKEQNLKNVFAEFVFDPSENPGPLGAIERCLEMAQLPLLVLAVDMPAMTVDFLSSMIDQCGDAATGLVCVQASGHGVHGPLFEPLCAVYPPGALALLREASQKKNYRMQDAVAALVADGLMQVRQLQADELPLFFNANTPEEYAWTKPAPPASN
ncbi:MAG: molybdenum cofactor guanylyltransferase [Verrucomicrobia bacterium]|nr:molybdenum cofactor guanylyltransferase [Verrucomicrobiota bacterium]